MQAGFQDDGPTRLEVLRSSTLLNGLTEGQLSEIAVQSKMAYAEKGELIWLLGNTVDFFGVVGSGFVKMSRLATGGQEVTTEIMGPGQIFGLLGAIDGTGCPQTAKAVTNTWYLKVRKTAFLPVYDSNMVLKEHLIRRTSLRLRMSFDMIAHLSAGRVDQRIAAVLLVLAGSFAQEREGMLVLDVPLTRQEISEIAGTTVESTIRVMSKWQKQGWVTTKNQQIVLKDIESLLATVRG